MNLKKLIYKELFLNLSDLITGQSVYSKFKFLQKSDSWTKQQIIDFQNNKLKQLIFHAYNYVPYYHDLFDNLSLKPNDIKTKEDLNKLPILTKAIIKKEGISRFTSTKYPKSKTVKMSSSGSTGEPLFYLTTKEAYSIRTA